MEFHGVGILALRADNHGTVPVGLREAPKASASWNAVPLHQRPLLLTYSAQQSNPA